MKIYKQRRKTRTRHHPNHPPKSDRYFKGNTDFIINIPLNILEQFSLNS